MLLELCLTVCLAADAQPVAASADELRATLAPKLLDHIYLRIGLGDGRGAARALTALAALDAPPDLLRQAAFAVLDLVDHTCLARDIRLRVVSRDADTRRAAADELVDAFRTLTAKPRLPDAAAGWQVLGPQHGCPVREVRTFAQGPAGALMMLADGLVLYDGARWQIVAPAALRVHWPVEAAFTDSAGRTWLGSVAAPVTAAGLLGRLHRYQWGTLAYFEPPRLDLLPGRWHAFTGTERITAFAQTKHGLWIASRSRLFQFRVDRPLPAVCPLPYSPSRRLIGSPAGAELWVIDHDRISRFDGAAWQSYRAPRDARLRGGVMLGRRPVILLDRGLLRPAGNTFRLVAAPDGLGRLTGAAPGKDGRLWCVSDRGHVLSTDLKTWDLYRAPAGATPQPRWPPAIFCDAAGRLWLSRGRGLELCTGRPGVPQHLPAAVKQLAARPAPLLSDAGSGGWPGDSAGLQVADEDDPRDDRPAPDSLGGFVEDAAKTETVAALLEALRKSPNSAATYARLLKRLKKTPDPAARMEAFALAVRGLNEAFYAEAAHVRQFAERLLDHDRPAHAYLLLTDAWYRRPDIRFRTELEPVLFEALTAMRFGEFARPGFLGADLLWRAATPAVPKTETPTPTFELAVGPVKTVFRARTLPLDPAVGRAALLKAGLHQAVILVDKRAVLGAVGDLARWQRLVASCIRAGDRAAARRYVALATQLFGRGRRELVKLLAGIPAVTKPLDSAALAPFAWFRRIDIAADSGLGAVPAGGGATVCVYDEGAARLIALNAVTGERVCRHAVAPGSLAALLPARRGLVLIVRAKDGLPGALRYLPGPDAKPVPLAVPIQGLTAAFDGFSATPVRDGVFYCFDGGLTKVDLNKGRVAWRNPRLPGGTAFWRSLLDRALPVPDGDDVFLLSGGTLRCVNADSGKVRWARDCEADGTPLVVGRIVVVPAGFREVWGVDRANGKPIWKHIALWNTDGALASDGRRAFYAAPRGDVTALDAKTGEFLWRRPTDISLSRPATRRERPTALIVRNGRLIASNIFGTVEFHGHTGAVRRRIELRTARPMVDTPHGVVVATAPGRLACIADPPDAALSDAVAARAAALKKAGDRVGAVGIARLAATYIDPARLDTYRFAFDALGKDQPRYAQLLCKMMIGGTDPFDAGTRLLMRQHLRDVPDDYWTASGAFALIVKAHRERGGTRAAAAAFAALARTRPSVLVRRALLQLQLAAGQKDNARATAQRLAALGVRGAQVAFVLLAEGAMEEDALRLAARFAGHKDAGTLLYLAVALSGRSGLFETAKDMMDRSPALASARDRTMALAYMLGNAGVADRAVRSYGGALAAELDRYRAALERRRQRLRAGNFPAELKAVEARIDRLKKSAFP